MKSFETPRPITATIEIGIGSVTVTAGDRADTEVEVRPTDPENEADVAAQKAISVEFLNGALTVKGPQGWRQWTPFSGQRSVDVHIDLPTGSRIQAHGGVVHLRCQGEVGDLSFRTGVGDLHVERAQTVSHRAGAGDVDIERVSGRADIKAAGAIRVGRIDGPAAVKSANGDIWLGETGGVTSVKAANGSITIDLAHAQTVTKTANGRVTLGEVERGSVVAASSMGSIDVGVSPGVAAWLDLKTKLGSVASELDASGRPERGEDAVEIHARTAMGDIAIHRTLLATSE